MSVLTLINYENPLFVDLKDSANKNSQGGSSIMGNKASSNLAEDSPVQLNLCV